MVLVIGCNVGVNLPPRLTRAKGCSQPNTGPSVLPVVVPVMPPSGHPRIASLLSPRTTSQLTESGDVYFLAKQMGTSVKMIEDHYGHITPVKNADRILLGLPGWQPNQPDITASR